MAAKFNWGGPEPNDVEMTDVEMADVEMTEPEYRECSICTENMDGYKNGKVVKLHGNHYFHKSCIDQAIAHDAKCPLCRRAVMPYAYEAVLPTGTPAPLSAAGGRKRSDP